MKFEILNRWTGAMQFECELEARYETEPRSVQMSAAVRIAIERGADLRDADLSGSVLTPIRDDLWAVLSAAPREVEGLRAALAEGRVNGSTYEGERACLVGTIANLRGVHYEELDSIRPDSTRPIERFFLLIRRGDVPATSEPARIALEWIDEWLASMRAAFSGPAA